MTQAYQTGSEYINAEYKQVKKKRKSRLSLLIFLLLFVVLGGFWLIRSCYLDQVTHGCEKQTAAIFDQAKTLDLSKLDRAAVPEQLADTPVVELVLEKLGKSGDAYGEDAKKCVSAAVTKLQEPVAKDITAHAGYEIRSVTSDSRRCTVVVHTENIDFGKVMSQLSSKAEKAFQKDKAAWEAEQQKKKEAHEKAEEERRKREEEEEKRRQESGFGWWYDFTDYVGEWFDNPLGAAPETAIEDDYDPNAVWVPEETLISDNILPWYKDAVAQITKDKKKTSQEGHVTFIRNKTNWRLEGVDPILLYSLYGIKKQ